MGKINIKKAKTSTQTNKPNDNDVDNNKPESKLDLNNLMDALPNLKKQNDNKVNKIIGKQKFKVSKKIKNDETIPSFVKVETKFNFKQF
jgi:ribosomal protein L39E